MCKDTNIIGTGEIYFLFGDENDGSGGRGDVCSMQDDGCDHDGGRWLCDSKRARLGARPFVFLGCFFCFFLGEAVRKLRPEPAFTQAIGD